MGFRFTDRHIVSIKDLSREEIEYILDVANDMEKFAKTGTNLLTGKILATLFYEPSTRTRLSFTTAMYKLGGQVIGFEDPKTTSFVKGETLVDTIRVIENYCDCIVIRHTTEGILKLATQFAHVPLISAGCGTAEHPTQTLLDLMTIRKEKGKIDGLRIGILGDIRYGRTAKSLVFALSNYDIDLALIAPEALKWPKEISLDINPSKLKETSDIEEALPDLDVLYVTRIQKERIPDALEYERVRGSYRISETLLKNAKDDLKILHPLPRVDEISFEVDETKHAAYFRQTYYGVLVRMALLVLVLGAIE